MKNDARSNHIRLLYGILYTNRHRNKAAIYMPVIGERNNIIFFCTLQRTLRFGSHGIDVHRNRIKHP